jgi:hypothetical protein
LNAGYQLDARANGLPFSLSWRNIRKGSLGISVPRRTHGDDLISDGGIGRGMLPIVEAALAYLLTLKLATGGGGSCRHGRVPYRLPATPATAKSMLAELGTVAVPIWA